MAKRSASIAVNIANGATTSGAVGVACGAIVGIDFPASMTGTSVTLLSSDAQFGVYKAHRISAGTVIAIPFFSNSLVQINLNDTTAINQWIQIVSNATELASRDLKLIIRDIS